MKRTIYYGVAMLLMLATIGTAAAGPNYVDDNNDGLCDLFVDGDGINDNCTGDGTGIGPCDGTGIGPCDGTGIGPCDGTGICPYDGTGIGPCDGTGFKNGGVQHNQ